MTGRANSIMRSRALLGSGLLVAVLAGCSNASDMTCAEFASLDFNDQNAAIWEMIEEQGLDPASSVMGTVQIGTDVNTFCGLTGVPGDTRPPSQNSSSKIEDAVNWQEYTR